MMKSELWHLAIKTRCSNIASMNQTSPMQQPTLTPHILYMRAKIHKVIYSLIKWAHAKFYGQYNRISIHPRTRTASVDESKKVVTESLIQRTANLMLFIAIPINDRKRTRHSAKTFSGFWNYPSEEITKHISHMHCILCVCKFQRFTCCHPRGELSGWLVSSGLIIYSLQRPSYVNPITMNKL